MWEEFLTFHWSSIEQEIKLRRAEIEESQIDEL